MHKDKCNQLKLSFFVVTFFISLFNITYSINLETLVLRFFISILVFMAVINYGKKVVKGID